MSTLLRNFRVVNEGRIQVLDVLIRNGRIHQIGTSLSDASASVLDGDGRLFLLPGLIDDQVHFREPGLTHKGDIQIESRAAVAGGITTYLEMPNTSPAATTRKLVQDKFDRAAQVSAANYAFYIGASNHNLDELRQADYSRIPGIKIFMGSSTGDLLVDDPAALEAVFALSGKQDIQLCTHCEYEPTVRANLDRARAQYGDDAPSRIHPLIRSAEACYESSSRAVEMARKHNSRLHVLHISTARELSLFQPGQLATKRITAEACVHHLWFTDADYERLGNRIKWNPAIKTEADRDAIRAALHDNRIDILATDHAPHTIEEKAKGYFDAPSGGPLVQHALLALHELVGQGHLSLELLVEKYCHNPAILFRIQERGYVREGYWADLVVLDPDAVTEVTADSLLYKCGWSPFEGQRFRASITHTFVNGQLAYAGGKVNPDVRGQAIAFSR